MKMLPATAAAPSAAPGTKEAGAAPVGFEVPVWPAKPVTGMLRVAEAVALAMERMEARVELPLYGF